MEINLQKIHVKTLWSIGALVIILLTIDLILRIYLNYHQIKYYKEVNGNGTANGTGNKHGHGI